MKMFPSPEAQVASDIALIDNSFAPELLCSGLSGLAVMNGIVTATFENIRCDHTRNPPPLERIVVARLSLSIPAAQGLLLGMHEFLGQHGLNPLPRLTETRQ